MSAQIADYLEIAHRRAVEKKTHVSFPQLKYPSLRDEEPKHPRQWLLGKTMDDGAEELWRVHNGLYDLSDFIDKHPGGSEWLELSKGTDITEAFETHHLGLAPANMLKSFYIRDAHCPRNSPFTFKEDGFYRTLKEGVRKELEKIPKNVTNKTNMITDGLLLTCIIASTLSCWFRDYWLVWGMYVIASFSLAWTLVASHNYLHKRDNWRMYIFNLGLWSYSDFRISHVLSHHLYTNTLMDFEVSGLEPIFCYIPRRNNPFHSKYCLFIVENLIFPFGMLLTFLKNIWCHFSKELKFTTSLSWRDGIGFLLPTFMYVTAGGGLYHVITTWLWILCTASYILFMIGISAGHHHPSIFQDGDEMSDQTIDWGIHELKTAMGRSDVDNNYFKVLTHFGHHVLHHLFPTLDHAILMYLEPVLLKHCKEFGANFRKTTQLDLFIGHLKQASRSDPTLLDYRQ